MYSIFCPKQGKDSALDEQTDAQSGDGKAGEISHQGGGDGMPGVTDPGGAEVDADGVKGGLGGAEHYGCGSAR